MKETIRLIITVTAIALSMVFGLYGWMMTVIANDLVKVVHTREAEIEEWKYEASRYKMMSEEYYELFINSQEFVTYE